MDACRDGVQRHRSIVACFPGPLQVVEAFDVLINEEQRAVYDKCRDYQVG